MRHRMKRPAGLPTPGLATASLTRGGAGGRSRTGNASFVRMQRHIVSGPTAGATKA